IQSNALKRQLSITEKQFTDYQDEKSRSIPHFIITNTPYHVIQAHDEKTGSSYQDEDFLELSPIIKLDSITFGCYISLKNIGAECKLSHIDISSFKIADSNMNFDPELVFRIDSDNSTIAYINITSNILTGNSSKLEAADLYLLYRELEMAFDLKLFYSQNQTSSSVSYKLCIGQQKYNLSKFNKD
ncbi:hypothetical protein ACT3RN_08575, partial [Psychrobacter sp. AOP5-GZ1-6]|uniref:hypothetical protein n=2 Tax=unclassified Psychrobacter TaxID=196806 RepID=UPI00402B4B39